MTLYFAYGEPLGKTRLEIRKITWMSGLRAGWAVQAPTPGSSASERGGKPGIVLPAHFHHFGFRWRAAAALKCDLPGHIVWARGRHAD